MNRTEQFRRAYKKAFSCKWKGGTASIKSHLKRRKMRGHLSRNATEADLLQKDLEVLQSRNATVYQYAPSGVMYFAVHDGWAVSFDDEGLWDTVFPPDIPERYFAESKGYRLLGKVGELIP